MPLDRPQDTLIPARDLQRFCTEVVACFDSPAADAELVAEALVEADLRGVHSHGVLLLPAYVERLKTGVINPRPKPRVCRAKSPVSTRNARRSSTPAWHRCTAR